MKFKFLPHTADLKFQAFGKTLEEAFENSALALTSNFHNGKIKKIKKKKIKAKGRDLEALMFRFLEEILFLFETDNFLVSSAKIRIEDNKILEAELFGEEKKRKTARHYIKAVTYNDMFVKKIKNKFVAQVVLDV